MLASLILCETHSVRLDLKILMCSFPQNLHLKELKCCTVRTKSYHCDNLYNVPVSQLELQSSYYLKSCAYSLSCLILCNPMDHSLSDSFVHGDSPLQEYTRVDCLKILQEIFPTQGSDPGLPHFRWTLLSAELPRKLILKVSLC